MAIVTVLISSVITEEYSDEELAALEELKQAGLLDADIDQLIEAVVATGVHLNRETGVEFALAVHVEPYMNFAMSVWVYVASLVRRR